MILQRCTRGFPAMGYPCQFRRGDDHCFAQDLIRPSLGGNGLFNSANLVLFVGHSAAGKETVLSLGHAQSYIPFYNSGFSSQMDWVGMNDMRLGSATCKWAAFYQLQLVSRFASSKSNLFLDEESRSFGDNGRPSHHAGLCQRNERPPRFFEALANSTAWRHRRRCQPHCFRCLALCV